MINALGDGWLCDGGGSGIVSERLGELRRDPFNPFLDNFGASVPQRW